MGNELLTGIITKLRDTFGYDTTIYLDEVKQELQEPCFFVRILEVSQEPGLDNRYRRKYFLDIEYHCDEDVQTARKFADVANTLLMAVEYIYMGDDLVRGTGIHYEVQDNVLHFFINYDFFVFRVPDEVPYMETLTQRGNLKG